MGIIHWLDQRCWHGKRTPGPESSPVPDSSPVGETLYFYSPMIPSVLLFSNKKRLGASQLQETTGGESAPGLSIRFSLMLPSITFPSL